MTIRFNELIHSVIQLNQGNTDFPIKISGNDEITRISELLKRHTEIITERNIIEHNLKETQDELIQTAKVAIVGQAMTTLAHEINQLLNAMSIYLFSLKKAISPEKNSQAEQYIEKMTKLTERITQIIMSTLGLIELGYASWGCCFLVWEGNFVGDLGACHLTTPT